MRKKEKNQSQGRWILYNPRKPTSKTAVVECYTTTCIFRCHYFVENTARAVFVVQVRNDMRARRRSMFQTNRCVVWIIFMEGEEEIESVEASDMTFAAAVVWIRCYIEIVLGIALYTTAAATTKSPSVTVAVFVHLSLVPYRFLNSHMLFFFGLNQNHSG